jgi:glycine/D-amino acid oxidase-like deaminating enzyme
VTAINTTRSGYKTIYTNIVLFGGGGTGWNIGWAASKLHYGNIILDTNFPANGSSIRNQAWLHNGSFYSFDRDMVQLCQRGFHSLLANYATTVHTNMQAYYHFAHLAQAEEFMSNCHAVDINTELVSGRQLEEYEPILRGPRHRYGVKTPDLCFNNAQYVQDIANQAFQLGTRFYPVERLIDITADWDGSFWHIFPGGNREIICNLIVLSCAALIPAILDKLSPGQSSGLRIIKNPVLALKADTLISNSLLLTSGETPDMHLVPFNCPGAVGATICCGGMQEDAIDHEDISLHPQWQETLIQYLRYYYPGIVDVVARNNGILAYPYSCHKVEHTRDQRENRANRQPFCDIYTPAQGAKGNIAVIYPGKLTNTPLLWDMFRDRLEPFLGDIDHNTTREGIEAPRITRQPYHSDAPYLLVVRNGKLRFEKIGPTM